MSMPASTSDACTAHATRPTGVAGSRSSSKDLSAGGMGVGRRVATTDAPRSGRPAASAGEVGVSRDAVLTAAATSPRCSAACRHRRLRSSSSVCAGALIDATGASAGAFVVAADGGGPSLTKTCTRSPRAMPHALSVEPSPAPCVDTSSVLLSVTATFSGGTAPSKHLVATAALSCERVHTSGTSTRIVSPDPAIRTRSLMPISRVARCPPLAPSTALPRRRRRISTTTTSSEEAFSVSISRGKR